MAPARSYAPLKVADLERLRDMALEEYENFFVRNPHLSDGYQDKLVGICLCQGAASHYLNPTVGINDYDVWHFFVEDVHTRFPYRAHNRSRYNGRRVDFLKRALPQRTVNLHSGKQDKIILAYLLERDTATKRKLLEKAVIGLFPSEMFAKVIWTGASQQQS